MKNSPPESWLVDWLEPRRMAIFGAAALLLGGWLLPGSAVTVIVGLLVCLFAAASTHGSRSDSESPESNLFEKLLRLARDEEVSARHIALLESHLTISRNQDPIYREIAVEQLQDVVHRADSIAAGVFVFEGTETWRIVYERLLRSPGLHLYRSVAWVKNANYWQDEPGRKSMAVNFELNDAEQLNIERIAIIADDLWPVDDVWPVESLRQWLHEQHARGI
jgi:hypothetical protein